MAGRLLPILLATVAGVAIGVATFDPELKEQQQKRLEEEYQRDVAAAGLKSEDVSPATKNPVIQENQPLPDPKNTKFSGVSSILGTWAWEKRWSSKTTTTTPSESQQSRNAQEGQSRQP